MLRVWEPSGQHPSPRTLKGAAVHTASLSGDQQPVRPRCRCVLQAAERVSEVLSSAPPTPPHPHVSPGLCLFGESEQFVAITTLPPTPDGVYTSLLGLALRRGPWGVASPGEGGGPV